MDPLALVVVVTSWIEFIFRDVSLGFTGFRALRCLMSRSEFLLVPHVPKESLLPHVPQRVRAGASCPQKSYFWCLASCTVLSCISGPQRVALVQYVPHRVPSGASRTWPFRVNTFKLPLLDMHHCLCTDKFSTRPSLLSDIPIAHRR